MANLSFLTAGFDKAVQQNTPLSIAADNIIFYMGKNDQKNFMNTLSKSPGASNQATWIARNGSDGSMHIEQTTPLLEACLHGKAEYVRIMLEQDPLAAPHKKTALENSLYGQISPYGYAKKTNQEDIVTIINALHPEKPRQERTPLWSNIRQFWHN